MQLQQFEYFIHCLEICLSTASGVWSQMLNLLEAFKNFLSVRFRLQVSSFYRLINFAKIFQMMGISKKHLSQRLDGDWPLSSERSSSLRWVILPVVGSSPLRGYLQASRRSAINTMPVLMQQWQFLGEKYEVVWVLIRDSWHGDTDGVWEGQMSVGQFSIQGHLTANY